MPNISAIDLLIVSVLIWSSLIFSLGYVRGRRRGRIEGRAEELIALRRKSYQAGKCSICGMKGKPYLITNTNKYQRKEEQLSDHDISVHL